LPFRGNTRMILHQVLHDEPRPPRRLNDRLPRDLETVCLKAMAKEPARRYPTAKEFADDLRRFLAGEPVKARPPGPVGRAWLWARRRPAAAALFAVSAVAALAVVGVGVGWKFNADLQRVNAQLQQAHGDVEERQKQLEQALQRAGQERDRAREQE